MIHLPPSDEGGGFCEAKDGGRELHKALYINEHTQNHSLLQSLCDSFLVRGSLSADFFYHLLKFYHSNKTGLFFYSPFFAFQIRNCRVG